MLVGVARIEFHIPAARSLKGKRAVVHSVRDRLASRLKVSVAEVDHQDLWQRFALGVAVVGSDARVIGGVLDQVRQVCESEMRAVVVDFQAEVR